MAAELMDWLVRSTVALSVAIVLLLVLRPLWRRALGPAGVLWLWLLVPAVLLATSVPRPARVVERPADVATTAFDAAPVESASAQVPPVADSLRQRTLATMSSLPVAAVLVPAWFAGALVLAGLFGWRQRRFLRRLGTLRP